MLGSVEASKDELAGLGAELHDLALLDDHHALAVRHGNDGAVGDDVVARPLCWKQRPEMRFWPFDGQHAPVDNASQ